MLVSLRSILRFPLVLFAFVVDQLRRLPGARQIERRTPWVVSALMLAALVALSVWMAQRSPQRITFPELVAGKLSRMQTWIIVSGELNAAPIPTTQYRYTLTDPAVPNAVLTVESQVELAVGQTTVSGTIVGGASRAQDDFGWVGQLRADSVLAKEPDPPWIAITLAAVGLFIGFGSRTFYPQYFRRVPRVVDPETKTLQVGVRRDWPSSGGNGQVVPGTVSLQRGEPVELRLGSESQQVRLHSAHSSVEAGELHRLFSSEPALILRPSTGQVTVSFASPNDRDAAFAALIADVMTPRVLGNR
ncbi:MAG: hypothetical protein ACR2H0_02555 [Candidatus Limnocylindrales bacterium]